MALRPDPRVVTRAFPNSRLQPPLQSRNRHRALSALCNWVAAVTFTSVATAQNAPGSDSPRDEAADAPDVAESADAYLKRGVQAYREGNHSRALQLYEKAYELDPRAELLYAIAQTHRARGDCNQALDYYQRFLASKPVKAAAQAAQANIERCQQELTAARPEPSDEHASPEGEPEDETPQPARTVTSADNDSAAEVPPPAATERPAQDAAPVPLGTAPWYADVWGGALSLSGVVVASVGGGFLVAGTRKRSNTQTRANDPSDDDTLQEHVDAWESSRQLETTGAWGIALGGTLLTAGIVRYLTRSESPADAGLGVHLSPGHASAELSGTF